jgi:hypothetical protein
MSTLATAILAEDDALKTITEHWERTKKTKSLQMTVVELFRRTSALQERIDPPILVVKGLPTLLKDQASEEYDPFNNLRSALKKVGKATTVLIQVEDLSWGTKTDRITLQGNEETVSEVMDQDTYTLRSYLKISDTKRNRFVKVKL